MYLEKTNNGEKTVVFAGEEDEVYDKMYELVGRFIVEKQFNFESIILGKNMKTIGVGLAKTYDGISYFIKFEVKSSKGEQK